MRLDAPRNGVALIDFDPSHDVGLPSRQSRDEELQKNVAGLRYLAVNFQLLDACHGSAWVG